LFLFLFFQTVDDFDLQLRTLLMTKYAGVAQDKMPEGYQEAPLAYDAIWAIALGNFLIIFQRKNLKGQICHATS
jgi:hypothetical protein